MAGISYRDAGVDIDAGERLVDRIKPLAAATRIPEQLGSIGGFAGLCGLPEGMRDPVLVSGTDGVGTKLKLAFEANVHATVGIDLVAMCVNDIVTVGARPLFFLDYFATGALDVEQATQVMAGIAEGCKQAGCALLGGETAELPGFYAKGEYDLAGFAVGVAERDALLDGTQAREGDVLLAVASSGLHSNGYSLARKVLLEHAGLKLTDTPAGLDAPLGEVLLRPTRMYAKAAREALEAGGVHALCHITGGGLPGNLPRVLGDALQARLDLSRVRRPAVFDLIARLGDVDPSEMLRTFNMGVGLVVAVAPRSAGAVEAALAQAGETVYRIGQLRARQGDAQVVYSGA